MRKLSYLIPVRLHTVYRENDATGIPHFVKWWMYMGRSFAVNNTAF